MTEDTPESVSPPSPTSDFSRFDDETRGWHLVESISPSGDSVRTDAAWAEVQKTRFRRVFLYLPTGRYWLFFSSGNWQPTKHFGVDLGTCSGDDKVARKEATAAIEHYRAAFRHDMLRSKCGVLPRFRDLSKTTWGQAWRMHLKIRDSEGVSEATKKRDVEYWDIIQSFYSDDLRDIPMVSFRRDQWLTWWQAVNDRYSRAHACNITSLWARVARAGQEIDPRLKLWSWPPTGLLGHTRFRRAPTVLNAPFLSRQDVEKVIKFTRTQTAHGLLDALYWRVMADAGLRQGEIPSLIWADARMSLERPVLHVEGRYVPLIEAGSEQLLEDLQMAWAILLPNGYDPIFPRPPSESAVKAIKDGTGHGSLVQKLPRFFVKSRLDAGYRIDRIAEWTRRNPVSILKDYLPEIVKKFDDVEEDAKSSAS